MSRSEKSLMNEQLACVSALDGCMAWRNNTGMAWQGTQRPLRMGQVVTVERGMMVLYDARPITFGLPGSADIMGVINGRAFGIESKALSGKQREQQKLFEQAFTRCGGLYGLAYNVEQAVDLLRGA